MAKVSDPSAIRALAHPLRLDLLETLGRGPATAAQCGRVLGVSQASCSFHLRQLDKYGLIEDAGPGEDRRERRWRLVDRRLSVNWEADPAAAREFNRVGIQREADRAIEYLQRRDDEPTQWREAGGGIATTLALTVAEAAELKKAWRSLLAPYEERAAATELRLGAGQRYVRLFWTATPLPTDLEGDSDD
jgi:DNA-binding transcriptional ArsR family regulator